MSLMTHFGFWIYTEPLECLADKLGSNRGWFVRVHQRDRARYAWWTWSHLVSLLPSGEQLPPI